MSAPEHIRELVYKRGGGKCECMEEVCSHHTGCCNAMLRGEWGVHRTDPEGAYTPNNVVAMCQECHRNMPIYEG